MCVPWVSQESKILGQMGLRQFLLNCFVGCWQGSRPDVPLRSAKIILAWTTPEDKLAHWAKPFFSILTDIAGDSVKSYLNRPGVKYVREMDAKFYLILSPSCKESARFC